MLVSLMVSKAESSHLITFSDDMIICVVVGDAGLFYPGKIEEKYMYIFLWWNI